MGRLIGLKDDLGAAELRPVGHQLGEAVLLFRKIEYYQRVTRILKLVLRIDLKNAFRLRELFPLHRRKMKTSSRR